MDSYTLGSYPAVKLCRVVMLVFFCSFVPGPSPPSPRPLCAAGFGWVQRGEESLLGLWHMLRRCPGESSLLI